MLPRQYVELAAARALGELRGREGDMTLEHQREITLHFGARRPDGDGAGYIRGPVAILAA